MSDALSSPVISWMENPRTDRGIRFVSDDGYTEAVTYDELAARAKGAGAAFLDSGCEPGDGVVIVLPTGPEFPAALWGCFAAGLTPTPVAPPGLFQDAGEYETHLRHVLDVADPALVVKSAEASRSIERTLDASSCGAKAIELPERYDDDLEVRGPADIALLQFTSGSSGNPTGVRVTRSALEANVRQIGDHVRYNGDEVGATWIPLYHDMGLIGCGMMAVTHQGNGYGMRPDQFVRDPARWLRCFGVDGATVTASPSFGFAFAAQYVRPSDIADMDFSGWRACMVGAERIEPLALQRFCDLAGPRGFRPEVYVPGYGLAEATLAVTSLDVDEAPQTAHIAWDELSFGKPIAVRQRGTIADAAAASQPSEWLVGCGRPLPGTSVHIEGPDGERLSECALGEIVIDGPSVADGYAGSGEQRSTRFEDGALYSGDAGFLLDGELYVIGRIGDALSVRGRNIYVEDIEARLGAVEGVSRARIAAFVGPGEVVAMVEGRGHRQADELCDVMMHQVGRAAAVSVVKAPHGSIARTTSGKPRRREMWRRHVEGELGGEVVASWRPGDGPPTRSSNGGGR